MGKTNAAKSKASNGSNPWLGRKFLQCVFVQVTGAIALFTLLIDGATYVALSSLALGIYSAASVAEQKVNK
jgi:hypothetical protein